MLIYSFRGWEIEKDTYTDELLEKVFFIYDRGNRINRRVIRLNKKIITIKADNGMEWKVSPDFLKRLV